MRIKKIIKVVDTHTEGEPTRIVISGLPYIKRKSMIEIKEEIILNYDYIRKIIMHEPRGHEGMFGAIITPPVDSDCDYGVIFTDTGGYCNMCGHGSIGVAKYAIESGLVERKYPLKKIKANTPAGRVKLEVKFNKEKNIERISLINVKSFNYLSNLEVKLPNSKVIFIDIAFSGNFFGIVDADKIGLGISIKNISKIKKIGMDILKYLNKNIRIQHPKIKKISSVDLIEFNSKVDLKNSNNKNVVIFGNSQFDRSPCGTGTSAKLANLYYQKKIGIGDEFINESIIGTKFIGKIIKIDSSDGINGVITKIEGNAFITGYSDFIIEEGDPFTEGFIIV